ncbi:MAG: tetratricopeptide repeat protein [Alloprevotella sp.]
MKRLTLLVCLLSIATAGFAQMQSGYVKTRGRQAADGSTIHGTRLAGATLSLKGRNAVGSDKNGVFKFDTKGRPFCLTGVQKQGYQICDRDLLGKTFRHSANEFIVVMDSPENIKADRLDSEDAIREQLQSRLKAKQEEIKRLRNQQKISEAKYNELRQQLYDEQRMNEKIISEMAERYATLDFDQLDDFQRQLEFLIRTGELRRADSLIATKGSMAERSAELDRMDKAIKKDAEDIARRQELHDKSVAMRNKKLEDFAADCYNRYKICLMSHKTDSAAYWLELRASKDTTNVDWQRDAGKFIHEYWAHYDDALRYFERALAGAEKDKSQEDMAICYNNIGSVYNAKGEYDKALEYFERASEILSTTLGERHPTVGVCYNNIGTIYHAKGEADKALDYYQKALDIDLETLGEAHETVATCYNNIGEIYKAKGLFDKALECYQKALDIDLKALRETHPDVAGYYNNMGYAFDEKGECEKALDCHLKALDIRRKTLGEKNLDVATSHYNVGFQYARLGDLDKALEHNLKALDIYLEITDDTSAEVETCYDNMRLVYANKHDYDKALEYSQKYLDLKRKTVGEKHPDTALAYAFIGGIYFRMDKFAAALESYQKGQHIASEIYQPASELFNQYIASVYFAAKAKGIELEGFKEFIAPRVFMAFSIEKTAAAACCLEGNYVWLELGDWTIDSNESLFHAIEAAAGQTKNIVVMKDDNISQHQLEIPTNLQISYVNVGEQEKERIIKAYKEWKTKSKR